MFFKFGLLEKCFLIVGYIFFLLVSSTKASTYWNINSDRALLWKPLAGKFHTDHIEMSGKKVSVVLRYGVDERGRFTLNKGMVWPLLRTIPNNTHASLMRRYSWNPLDAVTINGMALDAEKVTGVSLKGKLSVESLFNYGYRGQWKLLREYFPSIDQPALVEVYRIVNIGSRKLDIEIADLRQSVYTDANKGVDGEYCIDFKINRQGYFTILPHDTLCFSATLSARKKEECALFLNAEREESGRDSLVNLWMNNLVLETPDSIIDQMFAFSKIRACESIYETKGGPMHGPGGESFYAAIWANDQAEYINPYFPFVGYDYANESALNSYRHFARFMNQEWKPIPSSIIAEGIDIWNGAGDRGDAAMIAYGASRYALASGNEQEAEELWPLISWCLEYCRRKLNKEGVVCSDSDELEGRFPSGNANLCTSSLYYDALVSASFLAKELKKEAKLIRDYRQQARKLREDINRYFGSVVEGFDTYAYYKGNDVLRSWICIPLTVGIDERAKGTIEALFSPRLWTDNGLLTQAGSETYWDRSTLYALRGVYSVGETERATDYLHQYSKTRLLGNHVPYAIEAWPEGNQRHLSAESGLYGRIITEGLFGIRPIGFNRFLLTPHLPDKWEFMHLRKIHAFGSVFDIEVKKESNGCQLVTIIKDARRKCYKLKSKNTIEIDLAKF